MATVDPAPGVFSEALKQLPKDQPVVMLNLLAFRPQADYGSTPAAGCEPCSGREAYARYSADALRFVTACGGSVVFMGAAQLPLVAPADERWDEVLLVRYPSIQAFVSMVMNPDYQAITHHRTAALREARLIPLLATADPASS